MKTIYLEPDEEIISVIDRLSQTEIKEVNLVVPAGAQIWQNSINLKLLKRESDNLGKKITLFVPDDLKAEAAEKVGFIVKKERNFPIGLIRGEKKQSEGEKTKPAREDMLGLLVEELKPGEKIGSLPEEETDFLLEKEPAKVSQGRLASSMGGSPPEDEQVISDEKKRGFRWPGRPFKKPRKKMVDIISPGGDSGILRPRAKTDLLRGRQAPSSFFGQRFLKKKPSRSIPRLEPIKIRPMPREVGLGKLREREIVASSRWPKLFIIFIGLAFVVAALVGYLALPTTKIVISLKTEEISFDLVMVGDKDISQIDESLNKIPLQEIKVEKTKSKTSLASGEKQLNEKARGTLTIYNEYSSSPQTLVATTRFQSSEGKIFRIDRNIIVPGAEIEEGKIVPSSIEVEVVADQPGTDYNIGPTNFTIPGFKGTPKYASFYARSKTEMTGGFTGKVKVVLAEDLKKTEEDLIEELKNEVSQTLQEQIPTDLKLVEGGLKEEFTKISTVEEGTEADNFTIEIKAMVQALLFKEEDSKALVDLNLISQIRENKVPLPESQQINYEEPVIDWTKGEVTFNLHINEGVVWQIDTAALKKDLAGQSEIEVRSYLANRVEIEKAKVTFWPFWVKRIPLQEKKIEIEAHPSTAL